MSTEAHTNVTFCGQRDAKISDIAVPDTDPHGVQGQGADGEAMDRLSRWIDEGAPWTMTRKKER